MSVVVLVLALAVVAAAVGLLVTMYRKDKPILGALAIGLLLGPATILAFTYAVLA